MICSSYYSSQISAPDEQPIIVNTNAITSSDHTIQTVTSVETTSTIQTVTSVETTSTIQTVTSVETTSSDHTIQTVTSVETTVAKAISNCIGITEEVQQLDKLRKDLKILKHSNQPQNKDSYQKYRCLLSTLKAKVTALHREYCTSLKKFEKEF